MKIVAISDTHGQLPMMEPCDVLIHAGDMCPSFDHSLRFQLGWLQTNFRSWLKLQPADRIVGIAGNHDFVFEKWRHGRGCEDDPTHDLAHEWNYLQDSGIVIDGVKFYGLPWVPNLSNWAFHDTDEGLDSRFLQIPDDVDVVVAHGPPYGYLDFTTPKFGSVHAGFPGANEMLERVKPKAFICGHIHEGYGAVKHPSGAMLYNAAYVDENYVPGNPPHVIEL